MQGPGRHDHVEAGLVSRPGGHVSLVVSDPARPALGRGPLSQLDRGRVRVDGGDVIAGPGQLEAQRAGPATDIQSAMWLPR